MISSKNLMASQAVVDLGIGDAVRQQVDDEAEERKRKLGQLAGAQTGGAVGSEAGRMLLGPY